MKRQTDNEGHSLRFILLTTIALGCVGFICVLGVAQALTAENQGSTPFTKTSGGTVTRIYPNPASLAAGRARKKRGYAGEICGGTVKCTPPLLYMGGNVEHSPTVYVILWGSNWNTTGSVLGRQLIKMYKSLSGSKYQGILTQYFDTTGRISSTVTLTTYTDTSVASPTSVNETKVREEALKAIKVNGWTNNSNSQFAVIPAPGSTYEAGFNTGFCGYHAYNVANQLAYSFIGYAGEEPFRACIAYDLSGNANNATSKTAAHEYAESATDPNLTAVAWATSDPKGEEIADICNKETDEMISGVWVQGLWDNYQNQCSLSDPAPVFVYAITGQASAVTSTTATLGGTVNAEGMQTKYHFEYGTTTAYGTSAPVPDGSAGSGTSNQVKSQAITGLAANTLYHYALVASNSTGTAKGRDRTFKTSPAGFVGASGNVKTFPEKVTFQAAVGGPAVECKSASGEPAGTWTAQASSENAEGAQEALENGPHLLLNIKKWGTCTGPVGLGAKVKCEMQIASSSAGGEKELGTAATNPPECLIEVGSENICTVKIPVSGNKGISAVKLENSEKELSLGYELKGVTTTLSETKELCKSLGVKSGKEGVVKTSNAYLLEGLKLS
jgi:hypothetical protein